MYLFPSLLLAGLTVAAPVPKHGPNTFLVQESGRLKYLGPDGKVSREVADAFANNTARSPDSRWLACTERDPANRARLRAVVRPQAVGDPHIIPLNFDGNPGATDGLFVWAADGKRVLVAEEKFDFVRNQRQYAHQIYDLSTKKAADLAVPEGHQVTGWSPDGKRLLTTSGVPARMRLAWIPFEGKGQPDILTLDGEHAFGGRLSPDGTRVLYRAEAAVKYKGSEFQLFVLDLRTKKRTRVTPTDDGVPDSYCWNSTGTRIAYTWRQAFEDPRPVTEGETRLITAAPDGSDRKVVTARTLKRERNAPAVIHFLIFDWR